MLRALHRSCRVRPAALVLCSILGTAGKIEVQMRCKSVIDNGLWQCYEHRTGLVAEEDIICPRISRERKAVVGLEISLGHAPNALRGKKWEWIFDSESLRPLKSESTVLF